MFGRMFAKRLIDKMEDLALAYKHALNVLKTVPQLEGHSYYWEILRAFPVLNDQLKKRPIPGIRNRAEFQPSHHSSFREDVEDFGEFSDDAEVDDFGDKYGNL